MESCLAVVAARPSAKWNLPVPARLRWYTLPGDPQFLFPVFGGSGCVTSVIVAVLLDENRLPDNPVGDFGREGLHQDGKGVWYVVEFDSLDESAEAARDKLRIAVDALRNA